MAVDYLKTLGTELIRLGYPIVPIAPGYKYPRGLNNWQHIEATEADVRRWSNNGFKGGGVGVKTGRIVGIDIDVLDEDVAQQMVDYCDREIGVAPRRIGKAPKIMLALRAEEPSTKITSNTYVDFLGDEHRVEALGIGQQFVAYGTHPETGEPYRWSGGPGLSDTAPSDLPLVTQEQIHKLIGYFHEIVPDDWTVKSRSVNVNGDASVSVDPLDLVKPRIGLSIEQMRQDLGIIEEHADDYDLWVTVGMAIYHETQGSEDGFALFDEWSQNSVKYQDGDTRAKWKSFSNCPHNRKPITFAYVLKLKNDIVKKRQFRDDKAKIEAIDQGGTDEQDRCDPIDYVGLFESRYIFVEQGKMVCDQTRPPQRCLSKLDEFQAVTANIRVEVPSPTIADPTKTKMVPASNLWLVSSDRETAFAAGYHPGRGRDYTDTSDGLRFINTFHMPAFDLFDAGLGDTSVYHEHINYMFPNDEERRWFEDWAAFNVQHPEKRCKVTPCHVSVPHGTGRGWFNEVFNRLLGPWNCAKTKMEHLCGDGSAGAFNEYLDQTLFCVIEEVKESAKRYSVSDKIRSVLTDRYQDVNIKFGGKTTKEVFTNFFFMTNHVDALVIPEDDRRIQVLSGPSKVRDRSYYDRLYKWLEDDYNVAALYYYLINRDIRDFDWQRSTNTPGRARMVDCNLTPTEAAFNEFKRAAGRTAVTLAQAVIQIQAQMEGDAFDDPVDQRQVLKILQQHAVHHRQMKFNGSPVRPWLLGEWVEIDNDEVRKFLQFWEGKDEV